MTGDIMEKRDKGIGRHEEEDDGRHNGDKRQGNRKTRGGRWVRIRNEREEETGKGENESKIEKRKGEGMKRQRKEGKRMKRMQKKCEQERIMVGERERWRRRDEDGIRSRFEIGNGAKGDAEEMEEKLGRNRKGTEGYQDRGGVRGDGYVREEDGKGAKVGC